MKKFIILLMLSVILVYATRYWGPADFERIAKEKKTTGVMPGQVPFMYNNWQSWSYIHEICQTAAFVASMQVADSLDPEFGGIIEGEDALSIVETDNTQQAIWVWCRFYEITGDTAYFENIRRAWIYVMNHPAYQEEGTDSDYYRVWNCGLALFAEDKYRATFADTSFRDYADTCIVYMMQHPLSFDSVSWYYRKLHPKVTGLAAGMLYQYGKSMGDSTIMDTAIVYAQRVQAWIEQDPWNNINDEIWAMSGGTAVWGLCRSLFDADSSSGVVWLLDYLPYLKYYQPNGTWNNSWNIWYANARNFAARITDVGTYAKWHHALTDSLLVQDYDNDGGVPPTQGWNQNRDHSWVSNYMVFMGFEGLMDSIKQEDAGVNGIHASAPYPFFIPGDTIFLGVRAANYGFQPLSNVYIEINGAYNADTVISFAIGQEETLWFSSPWIPSDTGYFDFTAFCVYTGDERLTNDTLNSSVYVQPLRLASGFIRDSITQQGISAKLFFQFADDTGDVFFDSATTDPGTGNFSVFLVDSLYRVIIETDIPYPDFVKGSVHVTPDSITNLEFNLNPCDILIVNRDNEARYAEYYQKPLDSLGIASKVWESVDQGVLPISRINEFHYPIIIWFTGKAETDNVTPAEQDSLISFLESGGKLLISGQNIGEEISGSDFFANYLHAQLVNDSVHELKCYPDTIDSLGSQLGRLYTVGINGAGNQYSRDEIATDGNAYEFFFYDSTMTRCCAVWYRDPGFGYQSVYFSFGMEAITKPIPWTGFIRRKELLSKILDWFGLVGIVEHPVDILALNRFMLMPNPARTALQIYPNIGNVRNPVSIIIYDITGRIVRRYKSSGNFCGYTWDLQDQQGRKVASGVYIVSIRNEDNIQYKKAIIIH